MISKSINPTSILPFLFLAACTYDHEETNSPTVPTPCDLDSLYNFQNSYEVLMDIYKWNTGQGVTFDSVISTTLSFTIVDTNRIVVDMLHFQFDLELSTLSDSIYNFYDPNTSHPISHAYMGFDCLSDSCYIDFRSGALGYMDWYRTKFKYR